LVQDFGFKVLGLGQWFSTFHGVFPSSKDSQQLWPAAHQ